MKSFQDIGKEVGDLVDEKQAAYGDSFGKAGKVMSILYPDGIAPEALDDALTVVRVLDKLFRIATANGQNDAMGEDPWRDIVGYGLLSLRRCEQKMKGEIIGQTTPDTLNKTVDSEEKFWKEKEGK